MASSLPRWLPIGRATRARAARVLKLMLCALLVFGLFPGSNEVVETVAHLVHDGHLPHSESHEETSASEDCDESDEHGCTPLQHQCKCCASAPAIPPKLAADHARRAEHLMHVSLHDRAPPSAGPEPALRPPIA